MTHCNNLINDIFDVLLYIITSVQHLLKIQAILNLFKLRNFYNIEKLENVLLIDLIYLIYAYFDS